MAGCPTAWLWSVFHGGRWDCRGLNLYQLVLAWLAVGNARKKNEKKKQSRRGKNLTPTLQKYGGRGKEKKIKRVREGGNKKKEGKTK